MNEPHALLFEDLVRRTLVEDLGRAGDLTTDAIVAENLPAQASILARQSGRIAGLGVAACAFRLLDADARLEIRCADGSDVGPNETIAVIRGRARAVLSGERTALNFLSRLSGIATATRQVVASLEGLSARVVCTRKTTPGLRLLEKYAVRVGGGSNHRFGLDDAVLVKDNHRAIAGGVAEAVARVRRHAGHMVKIEVEVDTLAELQEALRVGVDAVLLDNMSLETLRDAVAIARGHAITEASGGITPQTARAVAETGVDLLSLGWLTHSVPAMDLALDVVAA
jgi:nicotinate-nucleotide pyrophosphorylase (carboxylating)